MTHIVEALSPMERFAYGLRRKPKVGETMWWRGMRMKIFEVREQHLVFKYKGYDYVCASSILEAVWNAELGFWTMPGVENEMPKMVRGKVVDPEPNKCSDCGDRTYRSKSNVDGLLLCTGCRVAKQEVTHG